MSKTYHAAVYGCPTAETGTVDAPIARQPLPSLLRCIHPDGKPSRTEYRVLEQKNGISKLQLHPITGRTHQLRLHCAHMGNPILGDPQYTTAECTALSHAMGLTHQLLCAVSLELNHPITGQALLLRSQMEITLP